MHQIHASLLLEIPLLLMAAGAAHLVVSFSQTVLHRALGHRRLGGMFYSNHVNFHHANYARDHLVSAEYIGEEHSNTPYFLIPVVLAGACAWFMLPLPVFLVVVLASAASFYAHVILDRAYHVEKSWFQRFAWFRRKQALHFVHHRHANTNFAVIEFFWDRLLGTYREPMAAVPPGSN